MPLPLDVKKSVIISWVHEFSCFPIFSIASSCTIDVPLAFSRVASRTDWWTSSSYLSACCPVHSLTLNSQPTALLLRPEPSSSNTRIFSIRSHHSLLVLGTLDSSWALHLEAIANSEITLNKHKNAKTWHWTDCKKATCLHYELKQKTEHHLVGPQLGAHALDTPVFWLFLIRAQMTRCCVYWFGSYK